MIKLLIFDLDGTLIDSAPDIIATVNGLMAARGRPPLPDETVKEAIGGGLRALVHNIFPETKTDRSFLVDLERDFLAIYEENLVRRTRVYPGAREFLRGCRAPVSIVTNKTERLARLTIERLDLTEFPWLRVFGADSLAKRKPDPLPLLETARLAGVAPCECVMIGDGIPDMIAAAAAGMHAIAVEFGYSKPATLTTLRPSASIASFSELADALEGVARLAPREPVRLDYPLDAVMASH